MSQTKKLGFNKREIYSCPQLTTCMYCTNVCVVFMLYMNIQYLPGFFNTGHHVGDTCT